MFANYGGKIEIEELWATEVGEAFDIYNDETANIETISGEGGRGPVFDPLVFSDNASGNGVVTNNNSMLTKYGDSTVGTLSAYDYEDIDIGTEVSSFCHELSGGNFEVIDFQNNSKNYNYLLTSSLVDGISGNYLYFKTNDDPLTTLHGITLNNLLSPSTWYRFTGVQEVSGNIAEIKQSESYLFIRYNNGNLDVYDVELETDNLVFSIDNNNCYFVGIMEELGMVTLDRGSYVDVRKLDNFSIISKPNKPSPLTAPIRFIVKNKKDEYLLIDSDNFGYLLVSLTSVPYIYDSDVSITDGSIVSCYYIKDNKTLVFNNYNGHIYITYVNISSSHVINTAVTLYDLNISPSIHAEDTVLLGSVGFYEKIILLDDKNKLHFFDLNTLNSYTNPVLGSGTMTNLYFIDKINMYDRSNPSMLRKIVGFSSGTTSLRKTHYFNASVTRTLETYIFLDTREKVIDVIDMMKPVHTKLLTLHIYDDIGVFGYGHHGLGKFGNGEMSLIQ
jgi:hypothetical protein